MKLLTSAIKFVLLFIIFQGCSLLAPEVEDLSDLDSEINKILKEDKIPSLTACIIKGDSTVWQNCYGYADYENRIEANNETIYELASISKLVIVTAIMQLKEQGLIDLHADINDYLPFQIRNPHYPEYKITILHLLTHTSGLAWPTDEDNVPGFYHYYPLDSAPPLSDWLPEYLLLNGKYYVPTVWKKAIPGKREQYSNIGAALLGYLVAVVSGIDFNTYCKQNIFEPLEMQNTSYSYSDLDMNKVAKIYSDNYTLIGYYRQLHFPAHSLKSSIDDFSHFIIAYMNGGLYKNSRILEENTIQEILTIRNPASGTCLIWDLDLGNWYGHSGGEPGISTRTEFQRDDKIGLLIFTNKRNKLVYPGKRIHACLRREVDKHR
jgi:CubicO group peptidase (beta-lactamase class C family)